jgi:hypothetical protein
MNADDWIIPNELQLLITAGRWPQTPQDAARQNLDPPDLVSFCLAHRVAGDEVRSSIRIR